MAVKSVVMEWDGVEGQEVTQNVRTVENKTAGDFGL